MENIIQKILNNKQDLVGIRVDGLFYDIDFIDTELAEGNSFIIYCYQLDENNCYLEYNFTSIDILHAREVKLYKLQEI